MSEAHHPVLESRMSMSLINKGLLNPTGENNCFLNSAVQVSSDIGYLKAHTCPIITHFLPLLAEAANFYLPVPLNCYLAPPNPKLFIQTSPKGIKAIGGIVKI